MPNEDTPQAETQDAPTEAEAPEATEASEENTPSSSADASPDPTPDSDPDSAPDPAPPPPPPPQPTPEEKIAQLNDQLLRALAEIENTRRRAERERGEALKYGVVGFARDILSVADNLSRALASLEETPEPQSPLLAGVTEGVQATARELHAILQRHRITALDPKGEKFDPNRHEALFEIPSQDHEAGIVLEVVEIGYMLEDRLLRPAKVGIAKPADAPKEAEKTPD